MSDSTRLQELLRSARDRLQHLTWAPIPSWIYGETRLEVTCRRPFEFDDRGYVLSPRGDGMEQLTNELAVLRAMRLHTGVDMGVVTVCLHNWHNLKLRKLHVLCGLPEWSSTLDMRYCTFTCAASVVSAYAHQLAQCIPTSYTTWVLEQERLGPLVPALWDALNTRRAGLGLPSLLIVLRGYEDGDTAMGEHVIVCGWDVMEERRTVTRRASVMAVLNG